MSLIKLSIPFNMSFLIIIVIHFDGVCKMARQHLSRCLVGGMGLPRGVLLLNKISAASHDALIRVDLIVPEKRAASEGEQRQRNMLTAYDKKTCRKSENNRRRTFRKFPNSHRISQPPLASGGFPGTIKSTALDRSVGQSPDFVQGTRRKPEDYRRRTFRKYQKTPQPIATQESPPVASS
ncbi:MAG: hypothetical protein IJH09_10720 [Clostridia bacterium]|nr:hypothetical protein [Clostridia bacterium]